MDAKTTNHRNEVIEKQQQEAVKRIIDLSKDPSLSISNIICLIGQELIMAMHRMEWHLLARAGNEPPPSVLPVALGKSSTSGEMPTEIAPGPRMGFPTAPD